MSHCVFSLNAVDLSYADAGSLVLADYLKFGFSGTIKKVMFVVTKELEANTTTNIGEFEVVIKIPRTGDAVTPKLKVTTGTKDSVGSVWSQDISKSFSGTDECLFSLELTTTAEDYNTLTGAGTLYLIIEEA